MTTTEMDTVCPFCGTRHECATGPLGGTPEDGDVTMCFACGQLCMFDHNATGGLRKPTKAERRTFARDKMVKQILATWRTFRN